MHVALANNDRARINKTLDHRGGGVRHEIFQRRCTRRIGQTGDVNIVFHRDGNATQRQGGTAVREVLIPGSGLGQRLFRIDRNKGVEVLMRIDAG